MEQWQHHIRQRTATPIVVDGTQSYLWYLRTSYDLDWKKETSPPRATTGHRYIKLPGVPCCRTSSIDARGGTGRKGGGGGWIVDGSGGGEMSQTTLDTRDNHLGNNAPETFCRVWWTIKDIASAQKSSTHKLLGCLSSSFTVPSKVAPLHLFRLNAWACFARVVVSSRFCSHVFQKVFEQTFSRFFFFRILPVGGLLQNSHHPHHLFHNDCNDYDFLLLI